MKAFDSLSLQYHREHYTEKLKGKGGYCPCCDRWGKYNAYTLNSGLVRCLIWLRNWNVKHPGQYCHLPTQGDRMVLTCNGTGKLVKWGFVEMKPEHRGHYRITENGRLFLENDGATHKKLWVYDNEVKARSEKMTTARQALGVKFDYDLMMQERYDEARKCES